MRDVAGICLTPTTLLKLIHCIMQFESFDWLGQDGIYTPYSMVYHIIRADILRVALYFSEPRRGEEKYEQ